eukprot:TRINITY_DN7851_c0_g1_i6.p1 TRINITY_DN7851_c0_g1~~TRINITY_DN7851_c0_g1_i6.p1  ORF type:complete len:1328 (-),score=420.88 TRINITY_DN7851_c0_g1_i6:63-4046(-)
MCIRDRYKNDPQRLCEKCVASLADGSLPTPKERLRARQGGGGARRPVAHDAVLTAAYVTLRVEPDCPDDALKPALRKLQMEFHPDRQTSAEDGAQKFDEAMRAYRVILAARRGESVAAANEASEDAGGYSVAQVVAGCNAPECQICHRPFGTFHRQHHCRACGRSVCDNCSPARQKMAHFNHFSAVRICAECASSGAATDSGGPKLAMIGAAPVLEGHEYLSDLRTAIRIVHEEAVTAPGQKDPFVSYTIVVRFEKGRSSNADAHELHSHYMAIHRRYSQFVWLNKELIRTFSEKVLPAMPSKVQMSFTSAGKIADARERREQLEAYLQALSSHRMFQASYAYKLFFTDDVDFATKDAALYQSLQPAMDDLMSVENWLRFRLEDVCLNRVEQEMHRRISTQTRRAEEQTECASEMTIAERSYLGRVATQEQRKAAFEARAPVQKERAGREDARKTHQVSSPGLVWVDRSQDDSYRTAEEEIRSKQKQAYADGYDAHGEAERSLAEHTFVHKEGRRGWEAEMPKWRNDVHDWLLDNVGAALPAHPSGVLAKLVDRRGWVKSEHPVEKARLDREAARFDLNCDALAKGDTRVFDERQVINTERDAWAVEDAALTAELECVAHERSARAAKEEVITKDLVDRETFMAERKAAQGLRKDSMDIRAREQAGWAAQHAERRQRVQERADGLCEICATQEARSARLVERLAAEEGGERLFDWDDEDIMELDRAAEERQLNQTLGMALGDLQQQVAEQQALALHCTEQHTPALSDLATDRIGHTQGNPRTIQESHEDCDPSNDPFAKDALNRRERVDSELTDEEARLALEEQRLQHESELFAESEVQVSEINTLLTQQIGDFKAHMEQRAAEAQIVRRLLALKRRRQKLAQDPVKKAMAHAKAIDQAIEEFMSAQQERFGELTKRQMDVPALMNKNRIREVALQQREAAQGLRLDALRTLLEEQQSSSVRQWGPLGLEQRVADRQKQNEAVEELGADTKAAGTLYSENGQCMLGHRHHVDEIVTLQSDLDERLQAAQEHWDRYPHDNLREGEDVEFLARLQAELNEVAVLAARGTSTIKTAQAQLEQEGEELLKEKAVLLALQGTLGDSEQHLSKEHQRLMEEDALHERNDNARTGKELAISRVATSLSTQLSGYSAQLTALQKSLASAVATLPQQGTDVTDRALLVEVEQGLSERMGQIEKLFIQATALTDSDLQYDANTTAAGQCVGRAGVLLTEWAIQREVSRGKLEDADAVSAGIVERAEVLEGLCDEVSDACLEISLVLSRVQFGHYAMPEEATELGKADEEDDWMTNHLKVLSEQKLSLIHISEPTRPY